MIEPKLEPEPLVTLGPTGCFSSAGVMLHFWLCSQTIYIVHIFLHLEAQIDPSSTALHVRGHAPQSVWWRRMQRPHAEKPFCLLFFKRTCTLQCWRSPKVSRGSLGKERALSHVGILLFLIKCCSSLALDFMNISTSLLYNVVTVVVIVTDLKK